MSWKSVAAAGVVLLSSGAVIQGCAVQCGASPRKLAELQRGMTYDQVSRIMGCGGSVVTGEGPAAGDFSIVEWDGPELILSMRTRLGFLQGRLLYYYTEGRGGF